MIAGGRLLHCFAQDEKTNFKSMSRKIDLEYDLCTRKLGLPLRPIDYRLNRSRGVQVFFLSLYISRLLVSSGALIFFAFIVYRLNCFKFSALRSFQFKIRNIIKLKAINSSTSNSRYISSPPLTLYLCYRSPSPPTPCRWQRAPFRRLIFIQSCYKIILERR